MVTFDFANTAFSLLPPLVAIVLAVMTRRVLLSLGVGIVIGLLMANGFAPLDSVTDLAGRIKDLFIDDGAINDWEVPLLGFLIVLGMTIALINASGAARAFASWARTRIRTRKNARLMTMALGFVIFIDDYFNTLTVGSVAKPVADDHKLSREELAYGVDSTAAPVCVMAPISSWGAYIVGLIGTIFAARGLEFGALSSFLQMIPMNLYAVFALLLLACVIVFDIRIGPMVGAAQRARETGALWDTSKGNPPGVDDKLEIADNGSVWGLLLPILTLMVASVYFILSTGAANLDADEAFSVMRALEETETTIALFMASLVSLVVALGFCLRQGLRAAVVGQALISGVKSMLPAVYILLFAWTIAGVIGDLETGTFLASLIGNATPLWLLPVLIFLLAGLCAFATGSSWSTFAIMLPIAADMALAADAAMLLPMMAAVLAGAVFGDHCSPISDTTVLSGTGAGCHHIDHVTTQLPYALTVALIAGLGYLAIGITGSATVGFVVSAIALVVAIVVLRGVSARQVMAKA
ncbi:Na+/H+ antiporter NhaC family protein [Ferrimonas pelagia]|uniref:Na+/H+ antiporter NhaC family protein n=1 Tax=Ferrimonas pelagia TaxID=1177826 RepID=A0ABP9EB72_9GAMM